MSLIFAEYEKRADLIGAPPHQGVSGTKLTQDTKCQVSGLPTQIVIQMRYFRRAYQVLTFSEYTAGADLTVAPPHQGEPGAKLIRDTKGQVHKPVHGPSL
jgi:hypothetical protein